MDGPTGRVWIRWILILLFILQLAIETYHSGIGEKPNLPKQSGGVDMFFTLPRLRLLKPRTVYSAHNCLAFLLGGGWRRFVSRNAINAPA